MEYKVMIADLPMIFYLICYARANRKMRIAKKELLQAQELEEYERGGNSE